MLAVLVLLLVSCTPAAPGPPMATPGRSDVRIPADLPTQFGIAYGNTLIGKSDQELDRALDDASALGVQTVRTDLDWGDIQPDSADRYVWGRFDQIVAGARARGLRLILVLAYTPPWARAEGCASHMCPPADPGRFAEFAASAASRYAPTVLAWEIWNEQNDSGFWSPAPDPEAYAELLQRTSVAIRRVDPSALILMGGLAAITTKGKGLSPTTFLSRTCARGAQDFISGVGYHPYTFPTLPSESESGPWGLIDRRPDSLRSVLTGCGKPEVRIWITEYGAPTAGPGDASDGGDTSDGTTHVTEDRQAAIAHDVLRTVAKDHNVQALVWYTDKDLIGDASTNLNFYGLRRADGSKKPAYDSFRSTLGELGLSAN